MIQTAYGGSAADGPRFGIILLFPLIAAGAAAILLGLLAIFVLWLSIVAILMMAIVASDLLRRSARRWLEPPVMHALPRRAVG